MAVGTKKDTDSSSFPRGLGGGKMWDLLGEASKAFVILRNKPGFSFGEYVKDFGKLL